MEQRKRWQQRAAAMMGTVVVAPVTKKVFKSALGLVQLEDYRQPAPAHFWERFPRNLNMVGKSAVNPAALEGLALVVGVTDQVAFELVCKDLREGADIGCRGEFREGSVSGNAPSAFEYPREISEAVAGWVQRGYAYGPVPAALVPVGAKINGIMCRPKPNGSARVILNLSAPQGRSVNDGIDPENFKAVMGSTLRWLRILEKAGRGALMMKLDWADAYKHIHVRKEDVKLQFFEWLGMFFAELCLVFGAASSAGLYDRLAKVVLDLVLRLSRFPRDMVCQFLDDVCAACPAGSPELAKFGEVYRQVAAEVGVRLAPLDDPSKAFLPTCTGVVLGVEYDTTNWTWRIPEEKLSRLLQQISMVMLARVVLQKEVWSLSGRILHYCPLVPTGRFNINYILQAGAESKDPRAQVRVSPELRRQLAFWELMLKTTSGLAKIPSVIATMPAWTIEAFTDAAGGSLEGPGRGSGGVSDEWWFYLPWPRKINSGVRGQDGKKLSRKLSALELVGPLVVLAAGADRCRGRPVRVWVDNAGSVKIWEKGYSMRCALCTTLVKASAAVAAALGCRFVVEKIRRCSTAGADMADALSKAQFGRCRQLAAMNSWKLQTEPARVPGTILRWLANPVKDDELGHRILKEMAVSQAVLGYNC